MSKPFLIRNNFSGHLVDLVAGIPSYNEAENIAFVVEELGIDYKRLKRVAVEDFSSRQNLIGQLLPAETAQAVEPMFQVGRFRLSALFWVNVVYSFFAAYSCARDRSKKLRIVEALKPLYFARVVSFIRETLELSHIENENNILRQATMFRSNRDLLIRNLAW